MAEHDLHAVSVIGVQQKNEEEPPMLMLEDERGRQLNIPIGLCEALAIQMAIASTQVGRPLTHDLLLILADRLEAPIERVVIDDYSQGTYYARLILRTPEGEVGLDCRPSDGIAVALRANASILASEGVLRGEETGE